MRPLHEAPFDGVYQQEACVPQLTQVPRQLTASLFWVSGDGWLPNVLEHQADVRASEAALLVDHVVVISPLAELAQARDRGS